jgi:hypothetical protein
MLSQNWCLNCDYLLVGQAYYMPEGYNWNNDWHETVEYPGKQLNYCTTLSINSTMCVGNRMHFHGQTLVSSWVRGSVTVKFKLATNKGKAAVKTVIDLRLHERPWLFSVAECILASQKRLVFPQCGNASDTFGRCMIQILARKPIILSPPPMVLLYLAWQILSWILKLCHDYFFWHSVQFFIQQSTI